MRTKIITIVAAMFLAGFAIAILIVGSTSTIYAQSVVGPTEVVTGQPVIWSSANDLVYDSWSWQVKMYDPPVLFTKNNVGLPPSPAGDFTVTFDVPGDYLLIFNAMGGGPTLFEHKWITVIEAPDEDPVEMIKDLLKDVRRMANAASVKLNHGNIKALKSKLRNAIASLEAGDVDGAVDKLNAFVNQVKAKVRTNRIPTRIGRHLVSNVNEILEILGS